MIIFKREKTTIEIVLYGIYTYLDLILFRFNNISKILMAFKLRNLLKCLKIINVSYYHLACK